ncbi:MAG: hypothetical protein ACHQ53_05925, partial [Polyangiales bacterium]
MKVSLPRRLVLLLSLCAGTFVSGCYGQAGPADDESVQRTAESLFIAKASDLWSSANPIPVCFQPTADVWTNQRAAYDAQKATIREWMEETYEGLPNIDINFTGFGECPNFAQFVNKDEGADKIEIGINGNGGAQSSGHNWIQAGLLTQETWLNHEVLHTLGFYAHEHQRTDSTGSVGTWAEYTGTPITCVDEIVYHVNPDGSLGEPACSPDNTRQDTPGIYLTKYDFWSILNGTNYCHCRDGLSDLDKLGLEMSYPTTASLSNSPVHFDYGFRTASSLVAFPTVVLHNDWFARGALTPAFAAGGLQWAAGPSFLGGVFDSG